MFKVVENALENFCFIPALSVPCQTRSHTAPPQNEAKTRPRWTQDAYLSSSSASLSKHLAKKVATCGQDRPRWPNLAPRWPNIAQHSAKMSQHSLQEPSQDPPKPSKSDELSSFFWFSLVLARSPPRSKKSHQDPPKSARKLPILGSKCAILATSGR